MQKQWPWALGPGPGPHPSPLWEIRLVSSPKEVKAYRGVDPQGRKLFFFSKDLLLEEQRGVVSYSLTTHCPVLFALGGLSISSARIPISTATPALLPGIVGEQERYFNQEQQEIKCMGYGGDYGFKRWKNTQLFKSLMIIGFLYFF